MISDTVNGYGMQAYIEVMRMSTDKQGAPTEVDISTTLRQIMAVRRLSVSDLANAAGVSKSAMEKYLAGPSSPRLVALIGLSKTLQISLDRLVFGESDANEELLFAVSFQEFASLVRDLKTDPELAPHFAPLDAQSEAFSDFVRDVAYLRAVRTRATWAAERRKAHHLGTTTVAI